jgi:hypothetical protein
VISAPSSARSPFFVWSGLVLLTALMAVWPLQHIIALRYLLLGLGLIWSLSGWAVYGSRREAGRLPLLVPLSLLLLTVWMYVQVFGWALAPDKVLSEIDGQWLVTLSSFAIGLSAAYLLPQQRRLLGRLLFVVLAVNVWALVGLDLVHWLQHGSLMRRYGGLESINPLAMADDSPDKASYVTNMYFAFLLAELVLRRAGRSMLGLGYTAIGVFFAVGLLATYIEDMRNGIAALGLMVLLAVVLLIAVAPRERRGRETVFATLILLLGAIPLGYVVSHQERWRTLMATVPIALDTQHNREWLIGGEPRLPNGQPTSASNYQRIAWAKEAWVVLMHNPLGVGYQRQAFGYGVDALYKTDMAHGMHSHSGILDLADGVGIPGLALWVTFIVATWFSALAAFRRRLIVSAAFVLFVVFDFSARSVVDSIFRDHMWQQFMFLAGFFASWTAIEAQRGEDA